MEQASYHENREHISIVLEIRGNAEKREKINKMLLDTLKIVQQTDAIVYCGVFKQDEKGISGSRFDSEK